MAFKIKRIHAMTLRDLKRNETLNYVNKPCASEIAGFSKCEKHCGKCEYLQFNDIQRNRIRFVTEK